MRDRSPIYIALSDLLLCVVSVVIVAVAPHMPKAHGPEQKVEYEITAEWGTETDSDVDLWVKLPTGKRVFYASRQEDCGTLDQDARGFITDHAILADGSIVKVASNKEIISLRCIAPGRYDIAAHMYAYRGATPDKELHGYGLMVHVEIIRINPVIKTEWSGDIVLDRHWQCVNTVSFDLSRDGVLTIVDPPLEPITTGIYREENK